MTVTMYQIKRQLDDIYGVGDFDKTELQDLYMKHISLLNFTLAILISNLLKESK